MHGRRPTCRGAVGTWSGYGQGSGLRVIGFSRALGRPCRNANRTLSRLGSWGAEGSGAA